MNGNWRSFMVLLSAASVLGACAPADKEVGSACPNGMCAAATLEGPTCTAVQQIAELAITNDPDRPGAVLGTVCLHRRYAKDAEGKVNCKVWWKLPKDPGPGMPRSCADLPFLSRSSDGPFTVRSSDGEACLVDQVPAPVASDEEPSEDGWFYQEDSPQCADDALGLRMAVTYTRGAAPPDVVTYLSCVETSISDVPDAGSEVTAAACELPADSADHTGSVGDPCTLNPPEGLAVESAVYVQNHAAECGTGVCLAVHVGGDLSRPCEEGETATPAGCVPEAELEQRVYCSCRCDAPAGSADACDCPKHFACTSTLLDGPPGLRGSYCVREGEPVDP
jgi:hypothetical protein